MQNYWDVSLARDSGKCPISRTKIPVKPSFANHSKALEGLDSRPISHHLVMITPATSHREKEFTMNDQKFFPKRSIQLCRLILLTFTLYIGSLFALYLWRGEFSQALSHLATTMLLLFFWSLQPLAKLVQKIQRFGKNSNER